MTILGIETSCDETSAAVIRADKGDKNVVMLSNIISSSLSLHAQTGGIIPEIAAREQIKYIIPAIRKSLEVLENPEREVDAIAVTVGPGLIGSLLVGVETARTISYVWNKPLIGVNHLFGHIYANFIRRKKEKDTGEIIFPAMALIISGGHTDLVLLKKHNDIVWLGGTRDDAAGEAFDKVGRLLGLPYPGGPEIEKMAAGRAKDYYKFPRPLMDSQDFDFSFSGLKTAVLRETEKTVPSEEAVKNISYSMQEAIFDVLATKTIRACKKFGAKTLLLGGGVAANRHLGKYFENRIKNINPGIVLSIPLKDLCTDNAAMIASAAFFNYKEISWAKISADPELYFD